MPKVKNISTKDKMVADHIVRPGETWNVTDAQMEHLYAGDPELEIVEEAEQEEAPADPQLVKTEPLKTGRKTARKSSKK